MARTNPSSLTSNASLRITSAQRRGLIQREAAQRAGTTASVLCRLEDADYQGHSLSILRRIAEAVDKRIEIRFLSKEKGGPGRQKQDVSQMVPE